MSRTSSVFVAASILEGTSLSVLRSNVFRNMVCVREAGLEASRRSAVGIVWLASSRTRVIVFCKLNLLLLENGILEQDKQDRLGQGHGVPMALHRE